MVSLLHSEFEINLMADRVEGNAKVHTLLFEAKKEADWHSKCSMGIYS